MEIIPSILTPSPSEAQSVLAALRNGPTWIQIDVIDGVFAGDQATWPLTDPDWVTMKTGEAGLPEWEHFLFEADLMVKNPKEMAECMVSAGAARLVFHATTLPDAELLALIDSYGALTECGVAFQLTQKPQDHAELIHAARVVQVMGVDPIGSQGQAFDERCFAHIDAVRAIRPDAIIQVDGGVSLETLPQLVAHGVDRVAPGSYITHAENPKAAYRVLYTEANGALGE